MGFEANPNASGGWKMSVANDSETGRLRRRSESARRYEKQSGGLVFSLRRGKGNPTFYDFQEKYLQYLKANTRPTTYVRYRKALQHFTNFLPSYGTASAKLSQISFQLIEEYKQERSKAVKSLTVNVELKVLKALYDFALKCRCARENPVSEVSFYREIEKKPRFLQKEEIKKFPRRG